MPATLTLFLSALFILALARVTMPQATSRFARQHPAITFLSMLGILITLWLATTSRTTHTEQRTPAYSLVKFKKVPSEPLLRRAKRLVKRGMRKATKKDVGDERAAGSQLHHALDILDRKGLTENTQSQITNIIENTYKKTEALDQRVQGLFKLDQSLATFDTKWLKRAKSVRLDQMTPKQQNILKQNVADERKRIRAEEGLGNLEIDLERHVRTVRAHLRKCEECIQEGNAAGAVGWMSKALTEEETALELERKAGDWENRLLRLLKDQQKALAET